MNLTLALGLKYESLQKEEFSPSRQEKFSSNLKQAVTTNDAELKSQPVIDVKPIAIDPITVTQAGSQPYHYLTYNMRATLDVLHAIGTQLHIII